MVKPFRFLPNPGILVGLVIALAMVLIAYQARPSYDIQLGTATDGPLLQGFNAGETAQGNKDLKFRWTTGDAFITLQDVGRQDFDVTISISGARPEGQPPPALTISADDKQLLATSPPPVTTEYKLSVPREAVTNGTLSLHLMTNAFSPAGDPRQLGVIVTHVKVQPGQSLDRFIEPPFLVLVGIGGAALLLSLLLALLGWGTGGVALGAILVGGLASWLLIADRLWLTSGQWYLSWPSTMLAGSVFLLIVALAGGWLLRVAHTPWTAWQRRALLTLMLLVFAIRLAGQLHPQIFIVDLMFHAHRFDTVRSGQLLFTIQSAEWGGHTTFYLPTAYVFMLPLQWILNDELYVIKLFTVAISTLGAFPIFYIAKRALNNASAGLFASTFYLTVPMSVLPFSWGITTNLFGEFFALCSLAILITSHRNLRLNKPTFWALLFTLLMALLSHPGVVQLTAVAFVVISLLWLVAGRIIIDRRNVAWALGTLTVAVAISYSIYYGHFAADMLNTLKQIQAERAAQAPTGGLHLKIGGSVADTSLGLIVHYVDTRREWFFGGLRGFWQEAQAYYRVWPLTGAALGYLLIWPFGRSVRAGRRNVDLRSERGLVVLAAVGWFLTVILFAIVGWVMNLYVRYALFALPVLSLGAGVLLAGIWRCSLWGRVLCALVLIFFAAEALTLWHFRITYAFK